MYGWRFLPEICLGRAFYGERLEGVVVFFVDLVPLVVPESPSNHRGLSIQAPAMTKVDFQVRFPQDLGSGSRRQFPCIRWTLTAKVFLCWSS